MPPITAWPRCEGMLRADDRFVSVTSSVEFSLQGELSILFDDIPLEQESAWLLHATHTDDGPFARSFAVQLLATNGETLISDRVYVTSVGMRTMDGRKTLRLKAKADALDVVVGPVNRSFMGEVHQLQYHTVGMLGFDRVRGDCIEGDMVTEGPPQMSPETILSGQIHLRRIDVVDPDSWISACDKRVLSTLRIVSLALGRPIDWTVREHFVDGQRARSRFLSAAHPLPAVEPVFTHLDLQPVLELALCNHDRLLDQDLRLGEAIDWVVQWHVLAEIRLLAAVTAFQGLLTGYSPAAGGLIPKACFRDTIRPRLHAALSGPDVRDAVRAALGHEMTEPQLDDLFAELSNKLGNLNQRSLPTRLVDFLGHYNVPMADLPISIIELLRTRNRVVHGANNLAVAYEERTTDRAAMMREVLRRSILAMLGYSGSFYSYFRGQQWLTFGAPPTRAT